MILIFLGAPGSGKGTQAEMFKNEGWVHLSTGDMFRNLMKEETDFAKEVKAILASGELISDEITTKLLKMNFKNLLDTKKNIILDGYPRTEQQVEDLKKIMDELSIKLTSIINFKMDEDLLVKRLINRRVCSICGKTYHLINSKPKQVGMCDNDSGKLIQRDDDFKEKIVVRMETYNKLTKPIISIYQEDKKVFDVDGNMNAKKVHKIIEEYLNEIN